MPLVALYIYHFHFLISYLYAFFIDMLIEITENFESCVSLRR